MIFKSWLFVLCFLYYFKNLDKIWSSCFTGWTHWISALLWHRLMGTGVLAVDRRNIAPNLRTYAHCSKGKVSASSCLTLNNYSHWSLNAGLKEHMIFCSSYVVYMLQPGITLLLINLSNRTHFTLSVHNILNMNIHTSQHKTLKKETSFVHGLKTTVSWVGLKSTDENLSREEYHLTPRRDNIQSKTMLLNGVPLKLTEDGDIPSLRPTMVKVDAPISIAPLSIKFVQFPNFDAPGCEWCISVLQLVKLVVFASIRKSYSSKCKKE